MHLKRTNQKPAPVLWVWIKIQEDMLWEQTAISQKK
jgi:hypothetical protein